jgi:hypothetical protein
VLTKSPARRPSTSWRFTRGGAAVIVSALTLNAVHAGGVGGLSCVGGVGSLNCVGQWGAGGDPNIRAVPQALRDEERAEALAREHKWLAQCQPVIDRDQYGVARYRYAARGCEYGVGAD